VNTFQHPTATAGRRLIPSAEYKARRGGISEMTRWREEQSGTGPKPVKLGGRNFYFEDEVDAYFSALATARSQNGAHAVGEGDTQDCLAERKEAQ